VSPSARIGAQLRGELHIAWGFTAADTRRP
jgi:hypothetical protein